MFTTPRLTIKTWTLDQDRDFLELSRDDGFNAFPINVYRQKDLAGAQAWIQQVRNQNEQSGLGKWGVWETQGQNLVGMAGLTPWKWEEEELVDITYRFRQSAWGQGYGSGLAQALVRFGFEVKGLQQITATITPDNIPSKKIAEKLGMKFDQRILLLGVPTDLYRLRRH